MRLTSRGRIARTVLLLALLVAAALILNAASGARCVDGDTGRVSASCAVHSPAPAPARTPEEDEPGWDCRTMGNRSCDPLADR